MLNLIYVYMKKVLEYLTIALVVLTLACSAVAGQLR